MSVLNIDKPLVSVIMGIYNCESTVSAAIESILNQTYQNFELILCDDGSTDSTRSIAERYLEKYPDKIILISNGENKGLNYTLNHCLRYANGKYVARMDGDDESMPQRFAIEVDYLEKHPEIAIVSAALYIFDDNGVWAEHTFIECPQPKDFMRSSPFSHSACMVRKTAYEAVGGYSVDKKLLRVEDYHLWTKMYCKGFKGVNLPDRLYRYRDDRNGIAKKKFKYRFNEAYVIGQAVSKFGLPFYCYIYMFRPIIVGLLPYPIYNKLHKMKMGKK